MPVRNYAIMGPGGKLGSNVYFKRGRGPKQLINKKPGNFDKERKIFRLAGVLHPMLGFSLVVDYTM